MQSYTDLIKALRGKFIAYDVTGNHNSAQLYKDAAAAIEDLQAEQKKTVTQIFGEEQIAWEGRCKDLLYQIADLQAEVPKRGEWVEENRRPRSSQFVCSECHRTAYDPQPTRDKAWKKRCRYAYCPNCGAKMEVQE